MEMLSNVGPIGAALVATGFTWLMTAAGAIPVFFTGRSNPRLMDASLGMAAGVMLAASFWSLLKPALEMSGGSWVTVSGGFVLGTLFVFILDKLLPHVHPSLSDPEGLKSSLSRSLLLVLAVTIHNIPEGLAVGVAFGAAGLSSSAGAETYAAAAGLALGIGLQNLPEGLAVALPLRREGLSRGRAFFFAQASGLVEPMAGLLGAWLVLNLAWLVPWAMAFAAGAMVYVVVEELIPESQRGRHNDLATVGCMAGFVLMMALDTALG